MLHVFLSETRDARLICMTRLKPVTAQLGVTDYIPIMMQAEACKQQMLARIADQRASCEMVRLLTAAATTTCMPAVCPRC